MSGNKTTLLILAPGYEELEAVAVVDILRRAGLAVTMAGIQPGPIPSARNVCIVPDSDLDQVKDKAFDLIVLPGGIDGVENLARDERVLEILRKQLEQGRAVGAICAAPALLDRLGFIHGKIITCHPVCQNAVRDSILEKARVVRDGNIITGQGPGAAMEFALKLVEFLAGKDKMHEVNKGVMAITD